MLSMGATGELCSFDCTPRRLLPFMTSLTTATKTCSAELVKDLLLTCRACLAGWNTLFCNSDQLTTDSKNFCLCEICLLTKLVAIATVGILKRCDTMGPDEAVEVVSVVGQWTDVGRPTHPVLLGTVMNHRVSTGFTVPVRCGAVRCMRWPIVQAGGVRKRRKRVNRQWHANVCSHHHHHCRSHVKSAPSPLVHHILIADVMFNVWLWVSPVTVWSHVILTQVWTSW